MAERPPYAIEFAPKAERQFLDLPEVIQRRLQPRINALAEDPRPTGCEKLEGFKNAYRIRMGDYRVVFVVSEAPRIVTITRVAHRSAVYRGL